MRIPPLFLALLLFATPAALSAQVVRGTLLNDETEQPLAAGRITLLTSDSVPVASVLTDSTGSFLLTPDRAGPFRVSAEREGFFSATSPPLRVGARDTLVVEFLLSTSTVLLDPIVVTRESYRENAFLADFYRRAERNAFGNFITRAEIERRHPHTTTALLSRIPGVRLIPRTLGGGNAVVVRGNCSPTVYVDGTRVHLFGSTIDDLIHPLSLEGIEVYRSAAEAPVEYGGMRAGCAVILLWSRRGE